MKHNEILFRCMVAGCSQGERAKYLKYVGYHTKFKLEREPENIHDPNAIKVMIPVKKGRHKLHLGYIPAKRALELAPLIDKGEKFKARFSLMALDEETGDRKGCIIKVGKVE